MSGKLFPYIGSSVFDAADVRSLGAGGALLLNDAIRRAPNLGGYTIGRDMLAFPDNVPFGGNEAEAYANGAARMREFYERYPLRLSARMGPNEHKPAVWTLAAAWLQGAFEAGAGDVCWRMGEDYIGGNWAYGNPELDGDWTHAAIVVEWLRAYRRWSPHSRLILGYHGYRQSKYDAQARAEAPWFEGRPWYSWKPAIEFADLEMPPVIMTEAGFDAGPIADNGYKGWLGSEAYAAYLRGLPALVPECRAFCLYLYCTNDPDKWDSFDLSGDEVVKAAIRETNAQQQNGGAPMPEAWDRAKVWADYKTRLDATPAFEKYRAAHPELGDWIDAAEYDVGDIRLRGAAGGLVWARIGDWAHVRHATYLAALPLA